MNNFDKNNETSLQAPEIVVRDSLGILAIEILKEQYPDFATMDRREVLRHLTDIVKLLQIAYKEII